MRSNGAARLTLTGKGKARVEIEHCGGEQGDVRLSRALSSVQVGKRYRLRFRARADRPRRVAHGLVQPGEPWCNLGLYEELFVDTHWRDFVVDFVAVATERRPYHCFWLGGDDAGVEVDGVRLEQN